MRRRPGTHDPAATRKPDSSVGSSGGRAAAPTTDPPEVASRPTRPGGPGGRSGPEGHGEGTGSGVPAGADARRGPGERRIRNRGLPVWLKGVLPLVLLAGLLALFLAFGPLGVFQAAFPPVEELTVERVEFPAPGALRVHVVNGGPEPVTIGQVMVDEAYWEYTVRPSPRVERLGDAVVDVPYPWVDGEPLAVTLVTETGVTFTAEVDVATRSPAPDARYLSTFALLGVYVGVIPVFLGLLWLPFLREVSDRWVHFFLSFTLGLLVFLGVDALAEAVEMSSAVASAFQGVGLLTLGLVATPLAIEAVGHLRHRPSGSEAWRAAVLIAVGIGLHNLGEGLAIGSSYAVGEIALGTSLVLGFLLHNTTEGIGIVAPISRERVSLASLVLLGVVAGAPTILGAWIGGFSYSPAAAVFFLAVGAGAVVQVVWTLWKLLDRRAAAEGGGGLTSPLNALGLVAGLAVMYLTGLWIPA